MSSFKKFILVFTLIAVCKAKPQRTQRARNEFIKRQKGEISDVIQPYPAAGFKPRIPFDLPRESPNTIDAPDNTYLPSARAGKEANLPDETYGPPDSAVKQLPPLDEDQIIDDDEESSDVIQFPDQQIHQLILPKSEKLLKRPVSFEKSSELERF